MDLDPMLLTFESLADHLRLDAGPAWQAAIDHGIVVQRLERSSATSPSLPRSA